MSTVFQLQGDIEAAYRTGWAAYLGHFTPAIFGVGGRFSAADQVEIALSGLALAAARWRSDPTARPRREATAQQRWQRAHAGGPGPADPLRHDLVAVFERHGHSQLIHLERRMGLPAELLPLRHGLQLQGLRQGAADAYQATFPRSTVLAVLDGLLREAPGGTPARR